MFTYLAGGFILLLLVVVAYGFGILMRRPPTKEELRTEFCSICRKRLGKDELVEREVGDSRVFYFCLDCIQSLCEEAKHRPSQTSHLRNSSG